MKQTLQSFYYNDFKKIFTKSSFKAFLRKNNVCDNSVLDRYWQQNINHKYFFEQMPDELVALYELRLGELYKDFELRVDDLLNRGIYPYQSNRSEDGDCDYVFLNNLRIKREKNSRYPQYYLRRDTASSSMHLSADWIEVEGSQIIGANILSAYLGKRISQSYKKSTSDSRIYLFSKKQSEDDLINHIFKVATHSLFNDPLSGHDLISGRADIQWARLRLSGLLVKDCGYVKDHMDGYHVLYAEDIRYAHVAGLLGYLYLRKHQDDVAERIERIKPLIENAFSELFHVSHFRYLEQTILKEQNQCQKIIFFEFIKINLNKLRFWEKDSPNKAFYAVFFNYDRSLNKFTGIPRDYFSYENMIAKEGDKSLWTKHRFLFPNKKSMKNAFKMDAAAFTVLFPNGGCCELYKTKVSKIQAQIDENAWRLLTHWIGTVEHPEFITYDQIKKLKSKVEQIFLGQVLKKTVDKFPLALNLIFRLMQEPNPLEEEMGEKISDCLDYIEGSQLLFSSDNQVIKTRKKNIHTLDSKTTIKSLERKSRDWHRMLELYNQCELLRRGEDYKKYTYDNLAELSFVESGIQFTVLQNRYELLMEGVDMRHCVADYHAKIKKGTYAVISLKRPTSLLESGYDRATLGVKLKEGVISLDQCRGIYNAVVSPELRDVVGLVIEKLNNKSYLIFNSDLHGLKEASC